MRAHAPTFSLGPAALAARFPEDFRQSDPTRDERRFLALTSTERPAPQAATVLQNRRSAIRKP